MYDEKQWNILAYQTMALDGRSINLTKKINAYLKKNNIGFDKTMEYLKQYDTEEFDEFIREQYDIKGEVTPVKIMSAKKKSEEKKLSEHEIQVAVCKYLKSKKIGHWAVPNGFVHNSNKDVKDKDRLATAKYINYMKSEGVKNGVFDITICYGNGKVAFLEIKTKKGKPSEHQLLWLEWFKNNGYLAKICYGYDECIDFIDSL